MEPQISQIYADFEYRDVLFRALRQQPAPEALAEQTRIGQSCTGTRSNVRAVVEVAEEIRARNSERLKAFSTISFNLRKSA